MARVEQKIVDKNILKSFLRIATAFTGIYLLSSLAIFKGRDFKTPGLSDEQIKAMDIHNDHHIQSDLLRFLGSGLGAGLSVIAPYAPTEIEAGEKASSEKGNKALDLEVAELPSPLKHTHTT